MALALNDVSFLQDLVSERSGNVVSSQQSYLFDRKLQPIAEAEGLASVEQLVGMLRDSASHYLCDRITEAMTINETFFFRDREPFEALRASILPRLIKRRSNTRRLRIWTSACSTGQEAYSIAITIREHFKELADWDVQIHASDISHDVLEKASEGEYTQFEVNRGLPAKLLLEYFTFENGVWKVKPSLRSMLEFRRVNLVEAWPPMDTYDIIFLRNVLIYFDVEKRHSILRRMHSQIAKDGCLIMGGGESLMRLDVPFERNQEDIYVFFRPTE